MAVKTTVVDGSGTERKTPLLMRSKATGGVVLFSEIDYLDDCGTGTVVHHECGDIHFVGEHNKQWRLSVFEPFHGTVTLESE